VNYSTHDVNHYTLKNIRSLFVLLPDDRGFWLTFLTVKSSFHDNVINLFINIIKIFVEFMM